MWDVIIAVCIMFAVCGPTWAIARFLKVSLPKFVLPMLAGISLLSYNAYERYTWGDRTINTFPDEIVMLKEYRSSTLFEPWTFLVPRVSHMIAADTRQTRTNPDFPNFVLGTSVMLQEHQDTLEMSVLVDCVDDRVSVVPRNEIAQGANPIEVAKWVGRDQFPFIADFYCKDFAQVGGAALSPAQ